MSISMDKLEKWVNLQKCFGPLYMEDSINQASSDSFWHTKHPQYYLALEIGKQLELPQCR